MAHRKHYNSKGFPVPSVTEVVKLLHKPELDSWANWMGRVRRIDTTKYLEEKAKYGSYYHDLFENYFFGFITKKFLDHNFVTEDEFQIILDKFKYIKERFDSLGLEVINMELDLDGERVGGTLDMLAYSKNLNSVFVFDLKSSKRAYQSHLIQTAGYSSLLEEVYGIRPTHVGIILISKPIGDSDMIQIVSRENNKDNEEIFNHLLDIYHLTRKEN